MSLDETCMTPGLDASPGYLTSPEAIRRMASSIPQHLQPSLRFLVVLRNPVSADFDCFRSLHANRTPRLLRRYTSSVAQRLRKWRNGTHTSVDVNSTLWRGLYHAQLRELWASFGQNQTLVLTEEALTLNSSDAISRVLHFLGVEGGGSGGSDQGGGGGGNSQATLVAAVQQRLGSLPGFTRPDGRQLACVPEDAGSALRSFFAADTAALLRAVAEASQARSLPPQQPKLPPFRYPPPCINTTRD